MVLLLFGSSGAGKTAIPDALRGRVPRLACHDFDELGVPPNPTKAWRQERLNAWARRAVALERDDIDMLLAAQSPYGEALCVPAAENLVVAGCLVDCADAVRIARLRKRTVPSSYSLDDRRMAGQIVDTTDAAVEESAAAVVAWVERERS